MKGRKAVKVVAQRKRGKNKKTRGEEEKKKWGDDESRFVHNEGSV
jgi:hypothetical protein